MFHVKHYEPVAFIRNSRLVVSDSQRQEPRNVFPSGNGVKATLSRPVSGHRDECFRLVYPRMVCSSPSIIKRRQLRVSTDKLATRLNTIAH